MEATKIAKSLAAVRSTVSIASQKNWIKVVGPGGAIVYIDQPGKRGESRRVHLSGWGYDGLPAGLELPAGAVKPVADNGAVSLEVDLDAAGTDWLDRALSALTKAEAVADPRAQGRRKGRAAGKAPDMMALLDQAESQARASAAAHAADSDDDSSDDSEIGELTGEG